MAESDNENNSKQKAEIKEQRRSTLADFRQNSFETRYTSIINKQILETSINTEEIKRQLSQFLPFGSAAGGAGGPRKENSEDDNFISGGGDGALIKKEQLNSDDITEEEEEIEEENLVKD